MSAPSSWSVDRIAGTAAEFHGRTLPSPAHRQVWVQDLSGPALVLGSTQSTEVVDAAAAVAAGVPVVRRRSGGGAVLVEPGGVVWVDVVVPAGDRLWDPDVGRAFAWVGEAWATALAGTGIAGPQVHRGPLITTPWSRLVCFGGLGPGEVTVGGAKVVGLAQRRTAQGTWFQGAVLRRWQPRDLVGLLRLEPGERAAAEADLAGRAAPVEVPGAALVEAFLAALPD